MANYTMNKITLVGYLGDTPELSTGSNGTVYCRLSLATHQMVQQEDKTWKQADTDWHRVILFGQRAENAAKYLKAGRRVLIEGRVSYSTFTRDDGSKGYSTSIIASEIGYL